MRSNESLESSMTKAHMRSLRAKVKHLISPDPCRCSLKRNDRAKQLQFKKKVFKAKQKKKEKQWGAYQYLEEEFYTEGKVEEKKPQFRKLAKEELIQISQFKHYYLGEKNILHFDKFVQTQKLGLNKQVKKSDPKLYRKHKSQYQLPHSLTRVPSNYRIMDYKKLLNKQQMKRQQAKSNYQKICETKSRKQLEAIQKSNSRLLLANKSKQGLINKYLQHLENKDEKFRLQRVKIKQKRVSEMQNLELDELASQLKKVCCFRPNFNHLPNK